MIVVVISAPTTTRMAPYPLIVLNLRILNSPGLMTKILPSVVLASLSIIGCHSADTGLAAFVPADTIALAGMRMDQVRTTQLYRKLREQKRFSELDDLKAKTGFDATRDVSELLLATNGKYAVTIARGHLCPPIRARGNRDTRDIR